MNDGSSHIQYLLKDHQGSLAEVAGSDGQITESYSFDAFGRRRNAQSWTMDNLPASYSIDRGYTFHEHLDAFGLINMNGRVYDPLVARFLSPDPFIQNPEYSQSYNRYSYVFNTPLRFVDPSGYFAEGDSTGGGNRSIPNLFLKTPPRIPEIYETNTDVAQGEIMVLKYEGEEDHSRNRTRAGETMAQTLLLSARTSQFPPALVITLGGGALLASYFYLMDNYAGYPLSDITLQIDTRSGREWQKREDWRGQQLQRDLLKSHNNMLNNGGVNNQGFPEDPNGIIPKGGGALFITFKALELYVNWNSTITPNPIPSSTTINKDTMIIIPYRPGYRP
jgi:RHS repeat-associated protein